MTPQELAADSLDEILAAAVRLADVVLDEDDVDSVVRAILMTVQKYGTVRYGQGVDAGDLMRRRWLAGRLGLGDVLS